ncbi:MAG: DinB family protein [Acidobacteriota bacterium]
MNISEIYTYLVRTRRDLWLTLESLPDEVLSRPLLDGSEFHCIKDFVFHIPAVEDGWIHEDILRDQPVRETIPALMNAEGGPAYAGFDLEALLGYWRSVEQSTLTYLATLTGDELGRVVILHDSPEESFTVDGLLWHVMIHEMRHTAQICVHLRAQGTKPPSLDLLFYLPSTKPNKPA